MKIERVRILKHDRVIGDYRLLVLAAPETAARAVPGQFVHIRVPFLESSALRRPFSLYRADAGEIWILYKVIGRGTASLAQVSCDDEIEIIGPLGNGFPDPDPAHYPVLVAGGYGVAPLYLLATRTPLKGSLFIGGASEGDILCTDEFETIGWDVHVATVDGSRGGTGFVTDVLDAWLTARRAETPAAPAPEFFGCGPDGMLKAIGDRALDGGWPGWLSMDKHMGCGVGACLACVQKTRDADGGEHWKRVCKDGPIFSASELVWGN
jgi:dihydroorotate dehydrogenase electron transfer subunit